MAGITLAQAEAQLTIWLNVLSSIGSKKSITIDGTTYTYQDINIVNDLVDRWNARVNALSRNSGAGGIRVREVIPR